jgi:long-chain acyl-CoA synthetase
MDEMNRIAVENKLSSLEKPKDIYLTLEAFSIENNILTPTFKLKRNIGREVYKAQIDTMYEALIKLGL